ncbi:MAG TPA: zinc-ribbon domain-containing protein, partial [Anaeromyxobacter sp.]
MRVACPHCHAAYNIDDRRIPASGLNVRCPKCRNAFPVRLEGAGAPGEGAVPLPAPAQARGAAARAAASIPLPVPGAAPPASIPLPAPEEPAFSEPIPAAEDASVPLPAPASDPLFSDVGARAERAPFPPPDLAGASEPFPGAGAEAQEPIPAAPVLGTEPVLGSEPFEAEPMPAEPPAPAEPLGFGEVDLGAPAPPDRLDAPPPAAGAPPAEDLEMLFGADGAAPPPPKAVRSGYRVRRRSGKIFGPFEEAQIVEMLGKGELMGNEDVSADGGDAWVPIGAVAAFGEALRNLATEPPAAGSAPAREPQRVAPFGTRMAAAKVTEGEEVPERRWVRIAIPAAVVLAVALVGVGAGFTRYGFFFSKALRRTDSARMAALTAQIRAAMAKGDYPSERAALALAAEAVAADPLAGSPAALHAMVVAALEQRHGAPPEAIEQARRDADRLEKDEAGEAPALAARLALVLATTPGASTAAQESALEQVAQKKAPDPEIVALLARAALARGDLARTAALFARLRALEPAGVRADFGQGLVAVSRRDAAAAKAAFEKVLAKAPDHLASRIELAALSEAAGDVAGAQAQLRPVLAEGAAAKLGPAERARALAIRGAILARSTASGAEA